MECASLLGRWVKKHHILVDWWDALVTIFFFFFLFFTYLFLFFFFF